MNSSFDLEIALFRFCLEAIEPLILPRENKGNVVRGAFGTIFKQLCCGSVCVNCSACPLRDGCAYAAIFEPSPPEDSERLRNLQDIPRPFVFRAPNDTRVRYEPGESFEFDLLLFGQARNYLAYFVLAFRELVERGFGIDRRKCKLRSVSAVDKGGRAREIYSSESQSVSASFDLTNAGDILRQSVVCRSMQVDFVTPTNLKYQGMTVDVPEFHHLIKRLRDRVNSLGWFYNKCTLDLDYSAFGARAESVKLTDSTIQWIDRERFSTRTRQKHSIGGFVGQATYIGEISEFVPLLRVGELVHVGKHAVWGNGQFTVQELA